MDARLASNSNGGWEPPELVHGFRVLAPLGRGAMGKVYLGRELDLDRLVTLKFMTVPDFVTTAHARFLAEARALARLDHPNVVRVFRIDELDGHPFIAYEYVRGESLERLLKPVRWQTALAICTRVARGVGAAHQAGLLHRDVKPANVMIAASGEVKLIDFGLAVDATARVATLDPQAAAAHGEAGLASEQRLTAPDLAVGTPRYWAPEQWRGLPATAATDVFGLGLVGYVLLTGELPHPELTGSDLSRALVSEEVPPLDPSLGPQRFLDTLARCMRREPAERYPTGKEAAAAFEAVETHFLPPGRNDALVSPDEDLVTASWTRVADARDALVARTYTLLFEARPELRPLFTHGIDAQRSMLLHALNLAVEGLRTPATVAPLLRELGRRHVGYGVSPSQLDDLGRAHRGALSELDPEWSETVDAAWEHAYAFIATSMRAGMRAPAHAASTPAAPPLPPSGSITAPTTAYAPVGGSSVAYQTFGRAPPDLVLLPSLLSQVEAAWAHPTPATLLGNLARFARVILLDRRGTGLSDPRQADLSLDDIVSDVEAVMARARSPRAIVVAASEAGLAGIHMAATRPHLVDALVLVGAAPRLSAAPDYPDGLPAEFFDDLARWMTEHWGEPMLAGAQAPSARDDPSFMAWLGSYYRLASSPRRALEALRFFQQADERDLLAKIEAPTLVLRRKGDALSSPGQARELAARIPRARFVELEGDDHFIFAGDVDEMAREIERFAAGLARTELATPAP